MGTYLYTVKVMGSLKCKKFENLDYDGVKEKAKKETAIVDVCCPLVAVPRT